jgi:hypothetical protein
MVIAITFAIWISVYIFQRGWFQGNGFPLFVFIFAAHSRTTDAQNLTGGP